MPIAIQFSMRFFLLAIFLLSAQAHALSLPDFDPKSIEVEDQRTSILPTTRIFQIPCAADYYIRIIKNEKIEIVYWPYRFLPGVKMFVTTPQFFRKCGVSVDDYVAHVKAISPDGDPERAICRTSTKYGSSLIDIRVAKECLRIAERSTCIASVIGGQNIFDYTDRFLLFSNDRSESPFRRTLSQAVANCSTPEQSISSSSRFVPRKVQHMPAVGTR